MSSDGAPRNIEGMKSRKVWVMAVAIMKIRRVWIGTVWIRVMLRRVVVIRLMWMPGIRPVIVPVVIPRRRGMIRFSISIL